MTAPLPPLPDDLVWGSAGYHTVVGQMQDYARLAVREALERAAVCAWSTGMDEYTGTLGLSDARETGSKCATAIRAMIEEYSE